MRIYRLCIYVTSNGLYLSQLFKTGDIILTIIFVSYAMVITDMQERIEN